MFGWWVSDAVVAAARAEQNFGAVAVGGAAVGCVNWRIRKVFGETWWVGI